MAKKKMTYDEMLKDALDVQKPYELPDGWVWVKVPKLFNIQYGKNLPVKSMCDDGYKVFGANGYIGYYMNYNISEERVLISCRGANSGIVNICEPYSFVTNNSLIIQPFLNDLKNEYIFYAFNSLDRKPLISGTAQPQVTVQAFNNYAFPLAPLLEQQRIVNSIESLFEKLDRAKELVQEALESFENRRSAILHKAFTGELTAKWREENGVSLDSWEKSTLESVCTSINDGDHQAPPKSDNGIPFLVISNMNTGKISFEKTRFVPKSYYNNLNDKRKPKKGDILYSVTGSFGIPAIVDTDNPFCFQRHIALIKPNAVNNVFLYYLLQSTLFYNEISQVTTGTAQLTIPIRALRSMKINVPTIGEQKQVVAILDSLIEKEDKAKELISIIDDIEIMKKTILAKAFRGELGTGNPDDEPAIKLVERIVREKCEGRN